MLSQKLEADLLSLSGSDFELDEDGKPSFFVEKILDVRLGRAGVREYKIKWKGLSYEQSSWVERKELEGDPLVSKVLEQWEAIVARDGIVALDAPKGRSEVMNDGPATRKPESGIKDNIVIDEDELRKKKELELLANRVPVGKSARRRWDGDPEYKIKRKEGPSAGDPAITQRPIPNQEELFGLSQVEPEQQLEEDWLSEANWVDQPSTIDPENVTPEIAPNKVSVDPGDSSDQIFSALPLHKRAAKDAKNISKKSASGPTASALVQSKLPSSLPVLKRGVAPNPRHLETSGEKQAKPNSGAPGKILGLQVPQKESQPIQDEVKTLTTIALSRDDYNIGDDSSVETLRSKNTQPNQPIKAVTAPVKHGIFGLTVPGYTNTLMDPKQSKKPRESCDPSDELRSSPDPDHYDQVEDPKPLYDRNGYYSAYTNLIGKRMPTTPGYQSSLTSSSSTAHPNHSNRNPGARRSISPDRDSDDYDLTDTNTAFRRRNDPNCRGSDPKYGLRPHGSYGGDNETDPDTNQKSSDHHNRPKGSPPSHVPRAGRGPKHRQQQLMAAVQRGYTHPPPLAAGSNTTVQNRPQGAFDDRRRGFGGGRALQQNNTGSEGFYASTKPQGRESPFQQQQFPMARVSRHPPADSSTSYRSTSEFSQFY